MRIPRANRLLNDAIEAIDQRFLEAKRQLPKGNHDEHIARAWDLLSSIELAFVAEEMANCVRSRVYYATQYHVIQPIEGAFTCLYPLHDHQVMVNDAIDRERAATGQSRIIVDKPRQAGITEWAIAVMSHCTFFTPNTYTVSVAQDPDVARAVQRKIAITLQGLPWWMRPETQYFNKGEYIEFNRKDIGERMTNPGLGSVFVTTHAQRSSGIAIGRTVRNLHMTEVSRWASTEVYTADLEPSMNAIDTNAICESTGLGDNGLFYNMWVEAIEGDSDWVPVFLPAYRARKFSLPLKPSQRPFELKSEELAIKERAKAEENFNVTDEFFNWRRRRIKSSIKRTGFDYAHKESYPCRWQESFQSSGLNYLPRHKLDELAAVVNKPSWVGDILFTGLHGVPKLVGRTVAPGEAIEKRETHNRLWRWEPPRSTAAYYIGGDTSAGIRDGDFQVLQVIRAGIGLSPDVQVAEWVGWAPATEFAKIAYSLGMYYNKAEIAIEFNNTGQLSCNYLANQLEYPNIYRPRSEDRIGKQLANYLHWQTTSKSKSLIGGTMIETLLENGLKLQSEYTLSEMYKLVKDGVNFSGLGAHDDGILALMIALFCLRQTMPELRSPAAAADSNQQAPTRSARASSSPGALTYGLFDEFMRMRGQGQNLERVTEIQQQHPGWIIKPIPISKVNTAFSLVHYGTGVENDLYKREGMDSWDITPGVVDAWRGARSADQGEESREFDSLVAGETYSDD